MTCLSEHFIRDDDAIGTPFWFLLASFVRFSANIRALDIYASATPVDCVNYPDLEPMLSSFSGTVRYFKGPSNECVCVDFLLRGGEGGRGVCRHRPR